MYFTSQSRINFFLVSIFVLVTFFSSNAQEIHKCPVDHFHEEQMKKDAAYRENFLRRNKEILSIIQDERRRKKLLKKSNLRSSSPCFPSEVEEILTVPIVMFIVHRSSDPTPGSGPSNPNDSQILQGVQDLNDAFRNIGHYAGHGHGANDPTNPDADLLKSVDIGIQFCLAKQDINGNPTKGIYRIRSNQYSNLDIDSEIPNMKKLVNDNIGGDLFPQSSYAVVWLFNELCSDNSGLGCDIGGYAGPSLGVLNQASLFGSNPDDSKTHIHEFGHYLNVWHPFSGNVCSNNNCLTEGDFVCDTPPDISTDEVNCGERVNTCNTDTNSGPFIRDQDDMYENYMDYARPTCQNTFTQGQKDRMRASLLSRPSLLQSRGCIDPTMLEVGITRIVGISSISCGDSVYPYVEVENNGNTEVTSIEIKVTLDDNTPLKITDNVRIPIGQKVQISLGNIVVPDVRSHTLLVEIINVNGDPADNYTKNNCLSTSFNNSIPLMLDYCESVEDGKISDFVIYNPSGNTFDIEKLSGCPSKNGKNVIRLNSINGGIGTENALFFKVDLRDYEETKLTFDLSYKNYYSNRKTTLDVSISEDCSTYQSYYNKTTSKLNTTSSPFNGSEEYIPSSCEDWRAETINLEQFSGKIITIKINVLQESSVAQNLYLDNICVMGIKCTPLQTNTPSPSEVCDQIDLSANGNTLKSDEIVGWWITKEKPITSDIKDLATTNIALQNAKIGGELSADANQIYPSTDGDLLTDLTLYTDCDKLTKDATYYATPFISGLAASINDMSCSVPSSSQGNVRFNGYPGKYASISPTEVCKPNHVSTPTYTFTIKISGYTGTKDNHRFLVRDDNFTGVTIFYKNLDGDGTYTFSNTEMNTEYDPGDSSWDTGITFISWEQGGNGMENATIEVSMSITYPGREEIPFPTVNYTSCEFGSPVAFTCECDKQCPDQASEVFINEFHYNNVGDDIGEFIEVAVLNTANVSLTDIAITLYAQDGNPYGSKNITLDKLTLGANDGTYTYYYWENDELANDVGGFALNCKDLLQFISYGNRITAVNGPARGNTSQNIQVSQNDENIIGSSLQLIDNLWMNTSCHTKGITNMVGPNLSSVPATAEITNSICSSNCTVSDGTISAPSVGCPTGSFVQYSTDNGNSWNSTLPKYDNTTEITIATRCQCDKNEYYVSPVASVTTNPGICSEPQLNVIITQPSCTVQGIISFSSNNPNTTFEISTDNETTYNPVTNPYAINSGEQNARRFIIRATDENGCTTIESVSTLKVENCCPDLTPPSPVIITDAICTDNCSLSKGQIQLPTNSCPMGANLQFSTDNGDNWTSSLPVYNQNNSITILTRCQCDNDPDKVSPTASVSTNPEICSEPQLNVTITQPSCTVQGIISFSSNTPNTTFEISTDNETTYNPVTNPYAINSGEQNARRFIIRATDENGCTTIESVSTLKVENCCPDLTPPSPVIITDAICTDNCSRSKGQIQLPTNSCPMGANLQFSTDNGDNWTSSLPEYNQNSSITILTRCQCDNDPDKVSPTASVSTNPEICSEPQLNVTITQPSCTVQGIISFSSNTPNTTFEISTDNETTYNPVTNPYPINSGEQNARRFIIRATDENGCTTVDSVTSNEVKNCTAPCPILTSAPPALTIVESICQDGCNVGGGTLSTSQTPCPTGSSIYYSTDDGNSWTSTLPQYDQIREMKIITRCQCDSDTTMVSSSTSITTNPGVCSDPELSVDYTQPTCTDDGEITLSSSSVDISYELSSDGGITFSIVTFPYKLSAGEQNQVSYAIRATDRNGCTTLKSISINEVKDCSAPCPTFTSAPPALTVIESTCQEECKVDGGSLSTSQTPCPTGSSIYYSIDNGDNWTPTLPLYDQRNAITILSRCQCNNDKSIYSNVITTITKPGNCVNPLLNILLTPPTCKRVGELMFESPKGAIEYSLDNGVTYSQYTPPLTLETNISTQQLYIIRAYDNNGCVTIDSVWINPNNCNEFDVYMPNIFSPNAQEESNKLFGPTVSAGSEIISYSMKIYNRWGNIVFSTNSIDQRWDGMIGGTPVMDGTYIYSVKINYRDQLGEGERTFNGTITLAR